MSSVIPSRIKDEPEVVISGMSGRFPSSDSIQEFKENLFNGVDMVTSEGSRWPLGLWDLPLCSGKVKSFDKFDADFFGYDPKEVDYLDPQDRKLLETTYEAILDAGVDPRTLRRSHTGLFQGSCFPEYHKDFKDPSAPAKYIPNQVTTISRWFGFRGPYVHIDTACGSAACALNEAYQAIKNGLCSQAIVTGANSVFQPIFSFEMLDLKMISKDGKSKCMDGSANGYARAEAVVVIFLQKRKNAKRVYATILNCKTNSDGWKAEGVTFPGQEGQAKLLRETYREVGLNPLDFTYVEAHTTGTTAGDPVELNAIYDVLCSGREASRSLLVGCIKSNIGHSEGASGLCALIKSLFVLQDKKIPPNLHLKTINENIRGLVDGKMTPVTEVTPFRGDTIPVNCFGFGGANVHFVLKSHDRQRTKESFKIADTFPRLINVCGRTLASVNYIYEKLLSTPALMTREFLSLLNDFSKGTIEDFPWRSYMVVTANRGSSPVIQVAPQLVKRRKVALFFADTMDDASLAFSLLNIPFVAQRMKALDPPLKDIGVDQVASLRKITRTRKENMALTLSLQVTLIDLIKTINVKVDEFSGRSFTELSCGYFDGLISGQQVIHSSFCGAAFYYSEENLKTSLDKLIMKKGRRSSGWKSDGPLIAGGDYYAEQILSPNNGLDQLSKDALIIEIGPWGLRKYGTTTDDACLETVKVLGELYMSGQSFNVEHLYPEVQYPIPTSVPSLSPLIKWAHTRSFSLDSRSIELNRKGVTAVLSKIIPFTFDRQNPEDAFLFDHKIDGRVLFPATGYLAMAWVALAKINQKSIFQVPVKFTDVQIIRATVLTPSKSVHFVVRMDDETGHFVVKDGDSVVVSGKMEVIADFNHFVKSDPSLDSANVVTLDITDIYKEYRVRGYDYDSYFQGLQSARSDGQEGQVIWRDVASRQSLDALNMSSSEDLWIRSFMTFADSLIQLTLLNGQATGRSLLVPTKVQSMMISPSSLRRAIDFADSFQDGLTMSPARTLNCRYRPYEDILESSGVILKGLKVTLLKRSPQMVRMKKYSFVSLNELDTYDDSQEMTANDDSEFTRHNILVYFDLILRLSDKILSNKYILDTQVTFDLENNRHSLLRILTDKLTHRDLTEVDLSKDLLFSPPKSDLIIPTRSIKPFFDLISYNLINKTSHNKLDIHEVLPDGQSWSLQSKLNLLMEESLFSDQTTINYTSSSMSNHQSLYEDTFQLIVSHFYQSMSSEESASHFRSLYKSVKDGGFLILLTNSRNIHPKIRKVLGQMKCDNLLPEFPSKNDLLMAANSAGFIEVGSKCSLDGVLPLEVTLLRKQTNDPRPEDHVIIEVSVSEYDWMEVLKNELRSVSDAENDRKRIWLTPKLPVPATSFVDKVTGLIGFVKSLRLEPGGDNIRCLIDWTSKSDLNLSDPKYAKILKCDLVYNIIQDGVLGTYEHLFYDDRPTKSDLENLPNLYLKSLKPGDLSSLTWVQSNMSQVSPDPSSVVKVHFAALNFKDIMYASGRLAADSVTGIDPLVAQDSLLGIEFAGSDLNGNRLMGVLPYKALATTIHLTENSFLLPVPTTWTLEEAATVPVVYSTAFYGLVVRGQLRPGESVLIHSGAGGVGMAALSIAISRGCTVYTTTGTKEKKDFLCRQFPKLRPNHIFNSRDISFEEDVMRATSGRGVDVVLNSLSGDRLKASLRCVADFGRFIEIGKVDLLADADLYSWQVTGNRSLHGVYPESFFRFNDKTDFYFPNRMTSERKYLQSLIIEGMKDGVVRPLPRTVFSMSKVEEAFRFMSSGRHVGKVVLKIRDDGESDLRPQLTLNPRNVLKVTYFNPVKSYLVVGGLGGFGLEVVQWMAEKGARKIVVNSRRGLRDPYQKYCIQRISENGVNVIVSQADSTTEVGVRSLLEVTSALGPIGGIFNCAAVFDDMLFADQTTHTFDNVCSPKVKATLLLDQLSRSLVPTLDHFVAFSSISGGRGNAGQTSYNFANSVIDSVCAQRRSLGLPGLSIQWGVVGDVGYVAEKSNSNNVQILGLSAQRMHSCLTHLDKFMSSGEAIVTCYVKAEKSVGDDLSGTTDILKVVSRILGLKDINSLDPSTTLGNLGIDSLIAVEIQQILERIQGSQVPLKMVKELKISEFVMMTNKTSSSPPAPLDAPSTAGG